MQSPILWQNSEHTVTLLDIAQSIVSAQQGSQDTPFPYRLLSSAPLLAPFATNEPKSASARAKLLQNSGDAGVHHLYSTVLSRALEDATFNCAGIWCLPRLSVGESNQPLKKRKLDHGGHDQFHSSEPERLQLPKDLLPSLAHGRNNTSCAYAPRPSRNLTRDTYLDNQDQSSKFFSNATNQTQLFQVVATGDQTTYNFRVAPGSSFYLGDCQDTQAFRNAFRNHAQETNSRKTFGFILLDPPWPNRSVKRTHKTPGSTYSTSPSIWDIRHLILNMELDSLLENSGLIGIWITNKPAVRDLVIGENGLFECWGVKLVEEWIWLKVTANGEPVTPIDALWRKPYEVLLIGRKRAISDANQSSRNVDNEQVKRRVLIGVPDLHSRKPCLKELIEPLLLKQRESRVLEVFARHLVAGWCSWGDECIKFNWEGCWSQRRERKQESI